MAPGATLLALDLFPHIRGTVASCQSFAVTLLGALVAGVIAPFLSHSVLWLALGQLASPCCALALWLASRRYRRRLAHRQADGAAGMHSSTYICGKHADFFRKVLFPSQNSCIYAKIRLLKPGTRA